MRSLFAALLCVAPLAGCCFDALGGMMPTVASTAPAAPPIATGGPHMPGGPGSAIFGRVTVPASGLAPDPTITPGVAGGPMALSTMSPGCLGYTSPTPSHHVTIEGETRVRLRLMAHGAGAEDLTIAVRGPDGQFLCNDDSDGLSPMVEDTLAPGEYDVWVGTYGAGMAGVTYDFGVTSNLLCTPTLLRSPPPWPAPAPGLDPSAGFPPPLPPG